MRVRRAGSAHRCANVGSNVYAPLALPARWQRTVLVSAHPPFRQWICPAQSPRVEALMKTAAERADVVSFAGGLPAEDLFPKRALSETVRRVMQEHADEALQYHWPEGYAPLREHLIGMLRERGIEVGPRELLITHGAQQALDLLARLFLRTGDPLAIESPTYSAAIQVFKLQRPRLCPLPRDEDGLDMDRVRDVFREVRPPLAYLAPSGHNPLGSALSAGTCEELLALAHAHDGFLVEDDAYGSIQFGGPRRPLRAYPGAEARVIHVGTFSKILTPGLRVGWIVASAEIIAHLMALKGAADLQTSSLSQLVLATYLQEFSLPSHLVRCNAAYRERRDAMITALADSFPPGLRWTRPSSGFSVWVELPLGSSAEDLLEAAVEAGVAFEPGAAFYPEEHRDDRLRLSFSNHSPAEIHEGIARLGRVLAERLG
jgi:2-aminoadipate transaminase